MPGIETMWTVFVVLAIIGLLFVAAMISIGSDDTEVSTTGGESNNGQEEEKENN